MKYLRKTGIRLILSLFLGGAIYEWTHIDKGVLNKPPSDNIMALVYALIIYIVLTYWSSRKKAR